MIILYCGIVAQTKFTDRRERKVFVCDHGADGFTIDRTYTSTRFDPPNAPFDDDIAVERKPFGSDIDDDQHA